MGVDVERSGVAVGCADVLRGESLLPYHPAGARAARVRGPHVRGTSELRADRLAAAACAGPAGARERRTAQGARGAEQDHHDRSAGDEGFGGHARGRLRHRADAVQAREGEDGECGEGGSEVHGSDPDGERLLLESVSGEATGGGPEGVRGGVCGRLREGGGREGERGVGEAPLL